MCVPKVGFPGSTVWVYLAVELFKMTPSYFIISQVV